jgi:ABC-type Fe3+/spermidine/putrescine transport system ATPase subunit
MLSLKYLRKQYEGRWLLDDVNLDVAQGEILGLLGESGSGKSTLLRITAGLEDAVSGQIFWNSKDITNLEPHKRGFGLMFQDYALFPHQTVAQNVAFGLRMQGLNKPEVDARVGKALETIRMSSFADRHVTELSGGEQQRVALARALAPDPSLLMLDEPLGALDHALRVELMHELRRVLFASGKPAIYVTHDREEAFAIADRLAVLHNGKIIQTGTPQECSTIPPMPGWLDFWRLATCSTPITNQPTQSRLLPRSASSPSANLVNTTLQQTSNCFSDPKIC